MSLPPFVLQPATKSHMGGVKPGPSLSIAPDGTLDAVMASTTLAGVVKPSGQGVEIANDGTLSAKQACRAAGFFNTRLEGYTHNDGVTDDAAGIIAAWIASKVLGLKLLIPPAWTKGGAATFTLVGSTIAIGGSATAGDGRVYLHGIPGATVIHYTGTGHAFHIGNGMQLPDGTGRGEIYGIALVGPGRGALRNGQTGILLDAATHMKIDVCYGAGFDIGLDFINNCMFTKVRDSHFGEGRSCNVGINLRGTPNTGMGNQLEFTANLVDGYVAGFYIGPTCDGIIIRGGQLSCGGGDGIDNSAAVVFGQNYLPEAVAQGQTVQPPLVGGVGVVLIDNVDFEGVLGRQIRGFASGNITVTGCPMITGDGLNGAYPPAQGVVKITNFGNGTFRYVSNDVTGCYADSRLMEIDGYGGSSIREENNLTDNLFCNYLAGPPATSTRVQMQSLLAQSRQVPGIAIYHEYGNAGRRAGDTIYMGGTYLQAPGGVLQTSADCVGWSTYAPLAPPALVFLAGLPAVAGGVSPILAIDGIQMFGRNGDAFTDCLDLSGWGNNSVSRGSSPPTLATGMRGINNRTALRLNPGGVAASNVTSLVAKLASYSLPPGLVLSKSDLTIVFVCRLDGVVASNNVNPGFCIGDTNLSNGIMIAPSQYGGGRQAVFRLSYGSRPIILAVGSLGAGSVLKFIVDYRAATGVLSAQLNGGAVVTGTLGVDTNTWTTFGIGTAGDGAATPQVSVGSCLVYPGGITDAERPKWVGYLTEVWGGA